MITGLSHVSIVVPNLQTAARELEKKYGLKIGEIRVNEQQGVRMAYVDLGNAKIELMEPSRPDSPVAKFLERNPRGGIHHFSLQVNSIQASIVELEHQGARVIGRHAEERARRAHRFRASAGLPWRAGRAGRAPQVIRKRNKGQNER